MALITDPDDLNQGTEVTINTSTRKITLTVAGNLSNDGVTLQALYSFFKEEWKSDSLLIPHPFPMIAITPEQFEFIENWAPTNNTTRKLIRTGGWREIEDDDTLDEEWPCVITLGNFVDENPTDGDLAYYQQGDDNTDTAAAVDFDFRGPVNEAVQSYHNVTPADTGTGFDITTNNVIGRADGGNWDTDGYKVGGRVEISNAEDAANNGTYLLSAVQNGVNGDLTIQQTGPDTGSGFDFTTTTITRNDSGSWLDEGYRVDGNVTVSLANTPANNGSYTITQVTATVITTTGLTADTGDTTAVFKPLVNNTADTTITFAVDDRNVLNVKVRERTSTGETEARTFDSSDLSAIGVTLVDNKVFRFPLANATDLKITETDANIDANTPYTNMDITYYSTAQSRSIGGSSYDFGIIIDGASGTAEEIYEFVQRQLRKDSDIDAGAGTVVGRTADELLIFVGETLVTGRAIPDNPIGGGSGVYIDNFDSNDTNRLIFTDNTGTERTFPFVAAGTINFNPNLVSDSEAYWWMFFEYSIRTTVADLVITAVAGANGTFDSAGSNLPTVVDTEYLFVQGKTGADEPMNGLYQVNDTTPTTSQIEVDRVDGTTIVTTGSSSCTIDENPIDSAGALIVEDNSGVPLATQAYTNAGFSITGIAGTSGTLNSSITDLTTAITNGDLITLSGTWNAANHGEWDITGAPAGTGPWTATMTKRIDTTPVNDTPGAGATVTARPVDGATYSFDFDYDGNTQGGRSASTDADVILRGIGLETAQFVESSGTILEAVGQTFSLVASLERNYSNP